MSKHFWSHKTVQFFCFVSIYEVCPKEVSQMCVIVNAGKKSARAIYVHLFDEMEWKTKSNKTSEKSKWLSCSWTFFFSNHKCEKIYKKYHCMRDKERKNEREIEKWENKRSTFIINRSLRATCVLKKFSVIVEATNVGRQKWNEMILKCT